MENTQAIRRAKLAQVLAADPFNGNKADLGRALGYLSICEWPRGPGIAWSNSHLRMALE